MDKGPLSHTLDELESALAGAGVTSGDLSPGLRWPFNSPLTPNVGIARRASNVRIMVDPQNGDDSPLNDGTVTPLRTLSALWDRIPAMGREVLIVLKAGEHVLEGYEQLSIPPGITIEGEWSEIQEFTFESFTDGVSINKSASEPAWSPDSHASRYVLFTREHPWGAYKEYYPIAANTSHSLVVSIVPWWVPPSPGTKMTIVEHASRIVPAANISRLLLSGSGKWQHLWFDGGAYPLWSEAGSLHSWFNRFSNGGYVLGAYRGGSLQAIGNVFENCQTCIYGQYSEVHARDNVGINCGTVIYMKGGRLTMESRHVAVGTRRYVYLRWGAFAHDARSGIYLDGATEYIQLAEPMCKYIDLAGQEIIGGYAPSKHLINAAAGARVAIRNSWSAEAGDPSATFWLNGNKLSLSDFRTEHNGDFYAGKDTHLIEF